MGFNLAFKGLRHLKIFIKVDSMTSKTLLQALLPESVNPPFNHNVSQNVYQTLPADRKYLLV